MQASQNGISDIQPFHADFPEELFVPKPGLTRDGVWDAVVTTLVRSVATLQLIGDAHPDRLNDALYGVAAQLERVSDLMQSLESAQAAEWRKKMA